MNSELEFPAEEPSEIDENERPPYSKVPRESNDTSGDDGTGQASDDDDELGPAPLEVEEDGGRPGSEHGKGSKATAEGKCGLDPQP
ncbi:hypothetical protein ACFX1R_013623 [Malus domestica]